MNILFYIIFILSPLRVGSAGSEPFVIEGNRGIAIEVWDKVAESNKIDYEVIRHYDNVDEAINAKKNGEIDVVVGPISITSQREKEAGPFSQPYFEADMAVMGHQNDTFWSKVKPFFSSGFYYGLIGFLILLFGVGFVVWLVERRRNLDFDPGWKGILEGAWFSIVTMTTVGYGDKAPRTHIGRALTAIWMLIGIILFSTFTAFLTNALDSKSDLGNISNKKVAVVKGTTGVEFARHRGAKILIVASLDDAITALDNKKVERIVFDGPALQYQLKIKPNNQYSVHLYDQSEYYGFILDENINSSILEMKESGQIQTIKDGWLSDI